MTKTYKISRRAKSLIEKHDQACQRYSMRGASDPDFYDEIEEEYHAKYQYLAKYISELENGRSKREEELQALVNSLQKRLEAARPEYITPNIIKYPESVYVGFDETGMAAFASNFQEQVQTALERYAESLDGESRT